MSEEMKMILALARSMGKDIFASGDDLPKKRVDDSCFGRDKSGNYVYEVQDRA